MRASELERRLREWSAEYAGGKYENLSYPATNVLARVVEMGGFVPGSNGRIASKERTPADEVERVVRQMEAEAFYWHAMVLRCWYFRPNIAMSHRLALMRSVGRAMRTETFEELLVEAHEIVAFKLGAGDQ